MFFLHFSTSCNNPLNGSLSVKEALCVIAAVTLNYNWNWLEFSVKAKLLHKINQTAVTSVASLPSNSSLCRSLPVWSSALVLTTAPDAASPQSHPSALLDCTDCGFILLWKETITLFYCFGTVSSHSPVWVSCVQRSLVILLRESSCFGNISDWIQS